MATKSVTTIETIKLDGKTVGLIMQDEQGYFYRPKGKSGLHSPKWDGEHFPTVAAVMQTVNGDPQATQATAEPAKGAKAATSAPKAPKEPTKASQKEQAAKPVDSPVKAAPTPMAAPVATVAPAGPVGASKVVYKVIETTSGVGTHYWLYAGYHHATGFKWNSTGGFMFATMEAVNSFLDANGITANSQVERVDVSNGGHYDPNKGFVIPLYKQGEQQALL